ncbi:heterokaryon incompatibility protein-domain-containing protein [Chaetomium strumarium]|uniref:Heterokaryon incompatibility protein-domain-containing protein n=1 Tax=Chaetomium strumarium TaxID=1170767 RepID=A0AAJ0GLH1_9PEZI|nr:heterokaryon incompatibility protein-domain-containing protein [Chaetomium strumarium]
MEFATQVLDATETESIESQPRCNESVNGMTDSFLCSGCRSLNLHSVVKLKLAGRKLPIDTRAKGRLRPYTWDVDWWHGIRADSPCRLCQIIATHNGVDWDPKIAAHSAQTFFKSDDVADTTVLQLPCYPITLLIPECDSDHRQHGGRPRIAARAIDSHRVDTSLLRQWLHDCFQNHKPSCSGAFADHLAGLKVIDCQTRKIVTVPHHRSYVALSYIWGQTASDAVTQPRQPDDPLSSNVPQVVEDAMIVAREIGIPYLWVDQYCINQADTVEKHHLIRHMDRIYSGATLTIVAAAGDDARYGLPGVSRDRRHQQASIVLGGRRLLAFPDATQDVRRSKWSTRAWTYQEGLLSRRRLVFTHSQVYFQCTKTYCWEWLSMPSNSTGRQVPLYRVFPEGVIGQHADDIVDRLREYAPRQLTFDSDALNAVLGIFQLYQARQVYHLWGVPFLADSARGNVERNFAMALGWTSDPSEAAERRPGMPSWSWAGWRYVSSLVVPWAPKYCYSVEPLPLSVRVFRRMPLPENEMSLAEYVAHIANGVDYTNFSQSLRVTGASSRCRIRSRSEFEVAFLPRQLMGEGTVSTVNVMAARGADYSLLFPEPLDILYLGHGGNSKAVIFRFVILQEMLGSIRYTRAGTLTIHYVPRPLRCDRTGQSVYGGAAAQTGANSRMASWLAAVNEAFRQTWQVKSFTVS